MAITAEAVKELRERTGAGMMDCKRALEETDGDLDKAIALLRERGVASAAKKAGRDAREGVVGSYIHMGGRIGAMIEVNCETDFVARTEQFQKLVRDLAMQVVALHAEYPTVDSIPAEVAAAKQAELLADETVQAKPEAVRGKIVEGQLKKWHQQVVLSEQPFRDSDITVGELITQSIATHRREHPGPPLRAVRDRGGAVTDDGRGNGDGGSTGPAEGRLRYHRILLKLSGEALLGDRQYGVDPAFCAFIARQVAEVHATGVQVGIVVGGGNIFRGLAAAARGMDRATGDYIGMLATVMNGLALQDAIERIGVPVRVMSAIAMNEIAEPYIRRRAVRHLEKGRVAIFVAGTGNPYFTTDTAAALRAVEIGAQVLLKATKVDGVYDADPMTSPNATRYERLGYQDLLRDQLKVLDAAAVSLCLENDLPIVVFDLNAPDNISRVARGEPVGTLISAQVGGVTG